MANESNLLKIVVSRCKRGFIIVAGVSAVINLLMLTLPIYMLQLFDRVLVGQHVETLIYLSIIAIFSLFTMSLLEIFRARILSRISQWLEQKISPLALNKCLDALLSGNKYGHLVIKDIALFRQFLSSTNLAALFDFPWVPIFVIVLFLLHSVLGIITVIGAIMIIAITIFYIYYSNNALVEVNKLAAVNQEYLDKSLDNPEPLEAMGFLSTVIKRWDRSNHTVLNTQQHVSDRTSLLFSLCKFIRLILQILILAGGAYLVIKGKLTAGAMIAGSILMGRALAPVEQAISSWKQAHLAKQAYQRLNTYFKLPKIRKESIHAPAVTGELAVENIMFIEQIEKKIILQGINFKLEPGKILGIVGHSGAGKTTLGRLIMGVWPVTRGSIRLDSFDVYQWDRLNFGEHAGYLPPENNLFPGTVKENIARQKIEDSNKVIEASKFVGAHQMITHLPSSYETKITRYALSSGQSRQVSLARAFYKKPQLIVLDEPDSGLDKIGIEGLIHALEKAKNENMTIILISQHREVLCHADFLLVLNQGKQQSFGENSLR